MEDGTRLNSQAWEKIYNVTAFGNRYLADGLVSLYYHFIRQNLAVTGRTAKVLDFGCSHGANAKFFAEMGMDVYGIDISQDAVDYCIQKQGFDSRKFAACNMLEEDEDFLSKRFGNFDLVIASECLYYFSKTDFDRLMQKFYNCMNENALIYANMHTWNHQLYRNYRNAGIDEEGLTEIPSSGMAELPLRVRMVEDKKEMREMFGIFHEIVTVRSVLEMESENETLHFIGKKKA